MTFEARALAQALLDHHKRSCRPLRKATPNIESCLITYGSLCEEAGLPHLKPTIGIYLREIAQWCHENGWPPLNSLAVNHESHRPGRGYNAAPGCNLERWSDQVSACVSFADYPDAIS
jgi:hypothetical protein